MAVRQREEASEVDSLLRTLVDKLHSGEVKLRDVENFLGCSHDSAAVRRSYFEERAGVRTSHIGSHTIDFNASHGATTANEIGVVQITVNAAGELQINGEYAKGIYPIFIAKEEGMLTEGLARGIGVLNAAGGVTTVVMKDGMARDILVGTSGVVDSKRLVDWTNSDGGVAFLKREFNNNVGGHGEFVGLTTDVIGKDVHMRFVGTTGSANGMNKITIASSKTVSAMLAHLRDNVGLNATLVSESGNTCTDKKPAFINSMLGRGVSVVAEIVIPKELVADKFKLTPQNIVELNTRKNLVGSAMAGSIGYNAHIANVLVGIYAATGQDLAHVISGSQGITLMTVDDNGDLYVTLRMPAIEVATYGGATKNETHKEILQLMGLYGEGDNDGKTRLAFAEVVASACVAGELNLIAVQAAKELALSHGSLRRS